MWVSQRGARVSAASGQAGHKVALREGSSTAKPQPCAGRHNGVDLGDGEAVEAGGQGNSVRAVVVVQQPAAQLQRRQQIAILHLVRAVARRAPHRTRHRVARLAVGLKGNATKPFRVEDRFDEGAVRAVVDVVHDALQVTGLTAHLPLGVYVRSQGEGGRHKVHSGLRDDVHVGRGEELGHARVDGLSHLAEDGLGLGVTRVAAADVEEPHAPDVKTLGDVEDMPGGAHRPAVDVLLPAARADVEAHAHHLQPQVARRAQQPRRVPLRVAAVLDAQAEGGVVRVAADAQHQPALWVQRAHLVQLLLVVERGQVDATARREADVRRGLGRLREDDPARVHAQAQHLLDLALGRAVEARPERGQRVEHDAAGVALDGVVRADARQQLAPQLHLVHHVVHVAQVEGVLLARGVAHGPQLVQRRQFRPQHVHVVLRLQQVFLQGTTTSMLHRANVGRSVKSAQMLDLP